MRLYKSKLRRDGRFNYYLDEKEAKDNEILDIYRMVKSKATEINQLALKLEANKKESDQHDLEQYFSDAPNVHNINLNGRVSDYSAKLGAKELDSVDMQSGPRNSI